MISPPLAERPTVRRAAVRLCRALMREAGVRLVDLQEEEHPHEFSAPAVALVKQFVAKQSDVLRQVFASAPPTPAPPQLVTPTEQPLTRALKRAGLGPRNKALDGVVARHAPLGGDVIVPPGVKVTHCPSGRDTRYLVEGPVLGEFTRDWIAKRGGQS